MIKKVLKKGFTMIMSLALVLGGSVWAFAVSTPLDAPRTVTVKLHKLDFKTSPQEKIKNTGEELAEDALKGGKPYDKNKNGDVAFTVYRLKNIPDADKKLKGQEIANKFKDSYNTDPRPNPLYGDAEVVAENVKVDDKGVAEFTLENLGKKGTGMFVFLETIKPANVEEAQPMFLSLPVKNKDKSEYLKTIHLYPKNVVTPSTVDLIKKIHEFGAAEDQVFKDVEFNLYKGTAPNGTLVKKPGTEESLVLKTNAEGKITIEDIQVGDYYLVETKAPKITKDGKSKEVAIPETAQNSAKNNLNFSKNAKGEITKSQIFADGFINYTEPGTVKTFGDDTTDKKNVNKDEVIDFKVKVDVPKNIDQYTKFEFVDKATEGLKMNVESVNIEGLTKGVDYTVSGTEDGYSLNFVVNGAMTDAFKAMADKTIEVKYTGSVEKVIIKHDGPGYTNTVDFTYKVGHDPKTIKSKVDVETYGKAFTKKDGGRLGLLASDSDMNMSGAEFLVQNDNFEILFNENGKYVFKRIDLETAYNDPNVVKLTSNEKGNFEIKGLKAGNYSIVEMKAPEGFDLPLGDDAITTFTVDENSYFDTDGQVKYQDVLNVRNPELPMTGSDYLIIFGGAGAVLLIIGAAIVLVRKRKHS